MLFIVARLNWRARVIPRRSPLQQMEKEVSKRGLHVVTISFNGPAQDASKRKEVLDSAKVAMTFLKKFGAERLVVFSPSRNAGAAPDAFKTMCECYNQLGEMAARAAAIRPLPSSAMAW
jgi:sugar phosphate isomerase/epimerase